METKTKEAQFCKFTIIGEDAARAVADILVLSGQWFEVTPILETAWTITVKAENRRLLDIL